MSYTDYQVGLSLTLTHGSKDYLGLIQGAMRLAPTDEDLARLVAVYPDVWEELKTRYHRYYYGGKLPEELELETKIKD